MTMSPWLIVWVAVVTVVFIATYKHGRVGRPLLPASFAWLAALGLGIALFGEFVPTTPWWVWVAYGFVALVVTRRFVSYRVAMAVIVVSMLAAICGGASLLLPSAQPETERVLVADGGDGVKTVAFIDNADQPEASTDAPVSGNDTIHDDFAPVSLQCDPGNKTSWTSLVKCVDGSSPAQKEAYIAYFNEHASTLGATWDDVQTITGLEQNGFDSRVILAINTDISDEQVRQAAQSAAGEAAATLPIARTSGALINTRGGVGEAELLEPYADARPQVRVMLTVPVALQQPTPDVEAASAGEGVLVECSNVATGVVPNPTPTKVVKKAVPKEKLMVSPSASPSASPSTSPSASPSASQPPAPSTTSTPPASTTSETPPASTTSSPSTTPPVTPPVCEWNPNLPPEHPDCLKPKDPADDHVDDGNEGKPQAPAPTEPAETAQPVESDPANPTDQPGDAIPATDEVTAPEATQEQSPDPLPSPQPTVAPAPAAPETDDVDPDAGNTNQKTSQVETTHEEVAAADTAASQPETSQDEAPAPAADVSSEAEAAPPTDGGSAGAAVLVSLLALARGRRNSYTHN